MLNLEENFVLFRLPNAKKVELWQGNILQNNSNYFTFQSFDNKYIINIYPNFTLSFNLDDFSPSSLPDLSLVSKSKPYEMSKEEYISLCQSFIEKLNQKSFSKLILSRVKLVEPITGIWGHFQFLCRQYPNAFVYVAQLNGSVWIGASPERLIEINQNRLKTVALAGTKPNDNQVEWTDKEREEHQLVVDYITPILPKNNLKLSQPYTVNLKHLSHLKTDISCDLSIENSIEKIVQELHPTPAVCGIPKQAAQEFILEHEPHLRSFYSGYFGIMGNDYSLLHVNLRCAQLFADKTSLYLGGGITAKSNPEKEWQETELKSKALFS